MKTTTLPLIGGGMLTAAVLVAGLGLAAARPPVPAPVLAPVLKGSDKPILLARVVVTATALPAEAGPAGPTAAR